MPRRDDPADQRGRALRHPAKGEEGGGDAGIGKQRQYHVGVALDPRFEARPIAPVDHRLEGADLEPLLHIDRQAVQHRIRPRTDG